MLSKSKGQILRVAAFLQVLFTLPMDEDQSSCSSSPEITVISEDAIKAAIDFVEVCCQQAAFIAGKGTIDEEVEVYTVIRGIAIHAHLQ